MSQFKWPTNKQHTLIVGGTGSGKSQFAAHMLSHAPFHIQPYIILDCKREELFNSIERARYIDWNEIPKHPGIYIKQFQPQIDDEKIENFLGRVYRKTKIGLVFDEGYMIPEGIVSAIYTQGRSLRIPIITLAQRPAWLTKFALSENTHYAYLRLSDPKDKEKLRGFVPRVPLWDLTKRLPPYHVRWYDVARDESFMIAPAPDSEKILETFDDRLKTKRKVF